MAGLQRQLQQDRHESGDPYLSPDQQTLLLAALKSQARPHPSVADTSVVSTQPAFSHSDDTMAATQHDQFFPSPQDADLDQFGLDYTPDLDYLDGDTTLDFENADLGGEMIGALPGDHHEKRKNPDDDEGIEEGNAKRQDTADGEKSAKKPGRKPLTSEPTTKRKAQNRAAQRAFRERKEKHLKDLETKVAELTKSQEADKHENGLLKAQVERLQVELREYRKRLSQSASISRSPTLTSTEGHQRSGSSSHGSLLFDFPKFGSLPNSNQMFGHGASSHAGSKASFSNSDSGTPPARHSSAPSVAPPPSVARQSSAGRSVSPQVMPGGQRASPSLSQSSGATPNFVPYSTNKNMHGFAGLFPPAGSAADPFGDLFSPSILKTVNSDGFFTNNATPAAASAHTNTNHITDNGGDSTAGVPGAFVFNSNSSASDGTSPSASSSTWNANAQSNSSCETSPEPSHDSPAHKESKSAMISPSNPYLQYQDGSSSAIDNPFTTQTAINFGSTDFDATSLGAFDPVLFGDYRDSNNAIVGAGDFTGGFFDDALNSSTLDYASPSNLFGILSNSSAPSSVTPENTAWSPASASKLGTYEKPGHPLEKPSSYLMAQIEKAKDGDDVEEVVHKKKEVPSNFISCNNIWSQLQSNSDFQEGKFDLDGLCSELRTKARCSESGVLVDQHHVDAALRKLGQPKSAAKTPPKSPGEKNWKDFTPSSDYLMFEQKSWDNVLKKLSRNSAASSSK